MKVKSGSLLPWMTSVSCVASPALPVQLMTFLELRNSMGEFADRYWNYMNKVAIVLLAVVDRTRKITFIGAGRPSSVGDAGAFKACELSDILDSEIALPAESNVYRIIYKITFRK